MATQMFFRAAIIFGGCRGRNDAKLNGSAIGWNVAALRTTRGAGVTSDTVGTVAGPTAGIEIEVVGTNDPLEWISPPLDAGVTISGTIEFNLHMSESGMNANAGAQIVIERLDNVGAVISTVINTEKGVEMGTAEAAQNWTATPTSTVFNKGDRIRIRVAANDVGTMGSGFTVTFFFDGPTAAASGDSWVTFTENMSFQEANPAGTQLYLTNTASDIADQGAGVDEKYLATARGDGVQSRVMDTVTGFTVPLLWRTATTGNQIEWYTKPLEAVTLTGIVKASIRALESAVGAEAGMSVEVAVVNGDGTSPTIYGSWGSTFASSGELDTAEQLHICYASGPNISIIAGQRIRVRVRLDDSSHAIVSGNTATLLYHGLSAMSGDSWVQFEQTITEQAGGNATVSAVTVAAAASVPAPSVRANAIASPASVAVVAAVPTPTLRSDQVASPAAVAALASVPAPTIAASAVAAPATVAVVAAVPAPTVIATSPDAVVTPATVAVVTAVPAPTIQAGAVAQPATAAAVAAVPAPTLASHQTATPATVVVVAAVPAPTISATAVTTPSAVAAAAAIPAPTVRADAITSPATVAAVAAVPAPTILTGGDATATPATVAVAAAVPPPTLASNQTVSPATVAAVAAVPGPTVRSDVVASPGTVAVVAAVPAPTISGSAKPTPATVAAVAAVPASTIQAAARATPATVAVLASVPAPTVLTETPDATAHPSTVAVAAAVPSPAVQADAIASPTTVDVLAAIPDPTIQATAQPTPTTVAAIVAVPAPVLQADAVVTPATVAVVAAVPAPTVRADAVITPATVAVVAAVPAPSFRSDSRPAPATVTVFAAIPGPSVIGTAQVSPSTVIVGVTIPAPTIIFTEPPLPISGIAFVWDVARDLAYARAGPVDDARAQSVDRVLHTAGASDARKSL